jgi:uncharacterized protein YueI
MILYTDRAKERKKLTEELILDFQLTKENLKDFIEIFSLASEMFGVKSEATPIDNDDIYFALHANIVVNHKTIKLLTTSARQSAKMITQSKDIKKESLALFKDLYQAMSENILDAILDAKPFD